MSTVTLDELLRLVQGPKQRDWEEIADQTYSCHIRHPYLTSIKVSISQLGDTGTVYSLHASHLGEKLGRWIGDVQPRFRECKSNDLQKIYWQAQQTYKERTTPKKP